MPELSQSGMKKDDSERFGFSPNLWDKKFHVTTGNVEFGQKHELCRILRISVKGRCPVRTPKSYAVKLARNLGQAKRYEIRSQ